MIGSDFISIKNLKRTVYCSECGNKIKIGDECLVSIKNKQIKKRVCSEECRLTFDDNYWQTIVYLKENYGSGKYTRKKKVH